MWGGRGTYSGEPDEKVILKQRRRRGEGFGLEYMKRGVNYKAQAV